MSKHIVCADCGFDPHALDAFEDVTIEFLNDAGGIDLTGHRNLHVSLASENADVEIVDLENMKPGMTYTLVAANGAGTQNEVIFPRNSTLYNGTIEKANGMTIVYRFFTDGYSIYCDRAVYA